MRFKSGFRIAVVITTWNRRDYAFEAAQSVLQQKTTGKMDFHLYVVDDGSTDSTVEFLKQKLGHETRFTVIASPNRERGAARNLGFQTAQKTFKPDAVIFLDSDDILAPETLERFYRCLETTKLGDPVAIYANSCLWDGEKKLGPVRFQKAQPRGDLGQTILTRSLFSIGSVLIDAKVFEKLKGFPEDRTLSGSEDWVLYARVAMQGQIEYSPHVSFYYRRHDGNTSPDRFRQSIQLSRQAIEEDLRERWPAHSRRLNRRMWKHAWLAISGTYCSSGKLRGAVSAIVEGISDQWTLLFEFKFWRLLASLLLQMLRRSQTSV